jgi:predicted DNA-binding transcriptional regulator YafY
MQLQSGEKMRNTLRDAIDSRRVLQVRYDGGDRVIEPHCLGSSAKGDMLLRAFQVSGASSSGDGTGWKLFRLDRIQYAQETGEEFAARPDYSRNDEAMKGGIVASV